LNKLKMTVLICTCMAVSGCDGTMRGVVRGKGTPVSFAYKQGMTSDSLTVVVDQETFQGRAVMSDATTITGTGFGTTQSGYATTSIFGTSSSGKFVATLLGSRGATMRCQLQYADTSGFTTAGGVGVCQHSDGRIIDVVW
jgi:hypothetical protein